MSEAAATTVLQTIADSPVQPASEESGGPSSQPDTTSPGADSTSDPEKVETKEEPVDALLIAKRFDAAKRTERNAKRIEIEAQKTKAQLDRVLAETEARAQALAEKEREIEAALEDPIAWALSKGKNPVELAERHFKPVTEQDKKFQAMEKRVQDLMESQKAAEQKRAEQENQIRAQQQAAAVEQQMVTFVYSITRDAYPHLTSEFDAHEVPELVERFVQSDDYAAFARTHGRHMDDDEIRSSLEKLAEKRHLDREARLHPSLRKNTQPSNGGGQVDSGQGHQATNGPRTLTNNHAAQAALRPAPKTREERVEGLKARLTATSTPRTSGRA